MMYGDIDGDGLTDVCGRGGEGIRCAIHGPAWRRTRSSIRISTALPPTSTTAAVGSVPHSYGSLRLADINGDGRADICGRGMWGLHCGVSMGSSFGLSQKMIPVNPFDEATGWSIDRYGSTMMLATSTATATKSLRSRPDPRRRRRLALRLRAVTGNRQLFGMRYAARP